MTTLTLPYNFTPRPYQLNILKALDSGYKRAVWVAHRRCGKDFTIFNWCIKHLFEEVCICYYLTPTYSQGRKIIWDSMTKEGLRFLDCIPPQIIESKNQQEMKIRFINGSLLQVVGADNVDSIVGTNPKVVVFSEYAVQDPNAWDFIRPIVRENKGYAIFISTPRGKNHFHEMRQIALDNPKIWFFESLTIEDTGAVTREEYLEEISTGMSEEKALQEYYVSFDRGIEGSFYGKLIDKMKKEGRIGNVPYETRSNVNTSWDIGFGDSTSIVFWQQVGSEFRVIDFYESHGEGIAHYAKVLQAKPYVYGTHFFPHDAGAGSVQTGRTLQQVAREQGINAVLLKRDDIGVGIEGARALLSMCYIDEHKCKYLIKCLENYHKKYNEKMNCYSETPVHDWSSHAADAFRYTAMSRQHFGSSSQGVNVLTPDRIRDMRQRNLGY
jgi:hypothetical protein